jgi:hypothetical protein
LKHYGISQLSALNSIRSIAITKVRKSAGKPKAKQNANLMTAFSLVLILRHARSNNRNSVSYSSAFIFSNLSSLYEHIEKLQAEINWFEAVSSGTNLSKSAS